MLHLSAFVALATIFLSSTSVKAASIDVRSADHSLCPDNSPALDVTVTYAANGEPLVQQTCTVTDKLVNKFDFLKHTNASSASDVGNGLEKRQSLNTCGAPCTTFCDPPGGTGPNPNDCSTWLRLVRDANQFYNIPAGQSIIWAYQSCLILVVNRIGVPVGFCGTQVADIGDYVAFNCQGPNYHGGSCHFWNDNPMAGLVGIAHS